MRYFLICAVLFAVTAGTLARAEENGLTASGRAAIEKAILEVNAEMTRAAEDRDIDRLFSFMLPNDRGSIVQTGKLLQSREEALDAVKNNFQRIASVKYRWNRQLITVISPTSAVLVCDGESDITTKQDSPATITMPFTQTVVFVLTDGKWKALHAHQSAIRQ